MAKKARVNIGTTRGAATPSTAREALDCAEEMESALTDFKHALTRLTTSYLRLESVRRKLRAIFTQIPD